MAKNNSELLKHWVVTGYDSQSVAGYGTSVEFLERATTSGEIPWGKSASDQNLLPYQEQILAGEGYLYYTFPFAENLEPYEPNLVNKLRGLDDLSHNYSRESLIHYANRLAIAHSFESLTGIKRDENEVVILAYLLFPTLVKRLKNDKILAYTLSAFSGRDWNNPPSLDLKSNMSIPRLKKIMVQSISRKGIIIYYNKEVLKNQVCGGFESANELIIHSRKPLTLDVISGIEPLSEADQKAVKNLIHKL